jgi:aminodeoxyfutalosine deaminase
MDDNYEALGTDLGLVDAAQAGLARNSVTASFLEPARRAALLAEIDAVAG